MAQNPGNDVVPFAEGQSFDNILNQAFSEATGAEAVPAEIAPPKVAPARSEPVTTEDVVEFEGKPIKVEKSAKDYLVEAMNAKKGMRKAFAERDKELKRIKDKEQDLIRYEQIISAFKGKGIEGLYDALAAKEGAYADHLKKRDELTLRKYNATEDELRQIHNEELLERERGLRELAEKTQKEVLENIQRKEESAQREILSSRINEAFEAVSFEGKLGNPKREERKNKYIWEQARIQLKEYAESKGIGHHEIPVKVIRSTFAEIASEEAEDLDKHVASTIVKQTQTASDAATMAAQARSTATIKDNDNSLEGLAEKHKNPHSFINAIFGRA